jgi:hypothetical protein
MSGGYGGLDLRCFTKDQKNAGPNYYANSTTGSDSNDGSASDKAFGANLDFYFDRLPKDLDHQPNLILAPGSYSISKQKSYLYNQLIPKVTASMLYLTWPAGGSQAATTIGTVTSNTRDGGIILTVSGGFRPDGTTFAADIVDEDPRYIGQKIRYQNGACAGLYAQVWKTAAPDVLYLSQVGSDFGLLPVNGNTFKWLFHTADINFTASIAFFDYLLQFYYPKFLGDFDISLNQAVIYLNGCDVQNRSWNPGGGQSSLYLMNVTRFKPTGGGTSMLAIPNGTLFTQNGTVIDGLTNTFSIQPASWRFKGETILKKVKSINMRGSTVDKNDVDSTLRFSECESGFVEAAAYPFTFSKVNMPYVAGSITGVGAGQGWLANMNGVRGTKYAMSGGTVTTPHGNNAITINGTDEGYHDDGIGADALQMGCFSGFDRYASTANNTPAPIASIPIAENKCFRLKATVIGRTAGMATVNLYTVDVLVKRATAGNVTIVSGGVTVVFEDDAACDVTLVANIGTQALDVMVTGLVAPTTMNWDFLCEAVTSYR